MGGLGYSVCTNCKISCLALCVPTTTATNTTAAPIRYQNNVSFEEVVEKIQNRDEKAAGYVGLLKHLLMRDADPKDRLNLNPPSDPNAPQQGSQLGLALLTLASQIDPRTANITWVMHQPFLHILLNDRIIDANQDWLRVKRKEEELGENLRRHAGWGQTCGHSYMDTHETCALIHTRAQPCGSR